MSMPLSDKEFLLDALGEKINSPSNLSSNPSQDSNGRASLNQAPRDSSYYQKPEIGVLKFDRRRRTLRKSVKYNPATWKPLYDAIILHLVMFGGKKKDIAAHFKVTPQTVSNVINCEQGIIKIRAAQERVREQMIRNIPQRMGDIAEKFVSRMEEFASDDTLYEKSPFAVIDRGMRFMAGTKLLAATNDGHTNSQVNNTSPVSEKALDRLSHALERIGEALPSSHAGEHQKQLNK